MKTKLLLIAGALALCALALYGATITSLTSLTALPDQAGVFSANNLAQLQANVATANTNATTANTNFTNINAVIGSATATPTGTGSVVLAVAPTITSAVLVTPALGAATITSLTGLVADCASTAACPSTSRALRAVIGIGLLATGSPSTYAVTTISPAFTGTTTYQCFAQDVTTIANNIGVLAAGYVSGSAVTFTGPNTNTDTFRFECIGY